MADSTSASQGANTAVKKGGDHDRVQMLSLHADGTPAQLNPEIIGDQDAALAATKQQFREQAVSAVDSEERAAAAVNEYADAPQDPSIEALQKKHDAAAKAAESAAEKAVKGLSS